MNAYSIRLVMTSGDVVHWGRAATWVKESDVSNIRFFADRDAAIKVAAQMGFGDENLTFVEWTVYGNPPPEALA